MANPSSKEDIFQPSIPAKLSTSSMAPTRTNSILAKLIFKQLRSIGNGGNRDDQGLPHKEPRSRSQIRGETQGARSYS